MLRTKRTLGGAENDQIILNVGARKALAMEHLAAGRLVKPFDLSLVTDFAYYVVCAKARADEPDLAAFRRWLAAEAQREPLMQRARPWRRRATNASFEPQG